MKAPECVDCIAEGVTRFRPTEGKRVKRCATHRRAFRKRSQSNAHGRMVENGYGITQEQYWALYEAQGRRCALCQVATGATKKLAVDHDHSCPEDHPRDKGCPRCVRGLVCGPCNQMLGRCPAGTFQRAIDYLDKPPARDLLWPMLTVIVPEPVPPSEAFWLWTPFDEDGYLDESRLADEGWHMAGAISEPTVEGGWFYVDDPYDEVI